MATNVIRDKSRNFALRIIRLYKFLSDEKHEYILSKQILRSGTSIGANVCEAIHSMSKKEFLSKMNISLKEAAETEYWLDLLFHSDYITEAQFSSINRDCTEIKSILISIIKSTNQSLKKQL